MSVFFAAGNLDVVTMTVGNIQTWSSSTYHETIFTNYACAFHPAQVGNITWPTVATDFWFHCRIHIGEWPSGRPANIFLFTRDNSLEYRLRGDGGPVPGTMMLQRTTDGTNWITLLTWTQVFQGYSGAELDIHIFPHATLGTAQVFLNGRSVGLFTGNTLAQTSTINRVEFNSFDAGTFAMLSQIVVADEPTISWKVQAALPNSSGLYTEWTGSYLDVDESIVDDNDFVLSNVGGTRVSMNITDPTTATLGSREIKGLVIASRGAVSTDSTPGDMQHLVRSNSNDFYSAGLGYTRTGELSTRSSIFELNPATGARFTLVEAAAVQVGVRTI